jgi:hypothetical protein
MQNNLITHMGRSGIVLCGYGAGTKYVNKNNQVISNLIHDVGELGLNGMGIYISMSGENRVAHNLIYNTPFNGISITGTKFWRIKDRRLRESFFVRWREIGRRDVFSYERLLPYIYTKDNVIEYNEIHHTCQNLGDDNGICISASGRGNIIRRNFVHDIYGKHKNAGIRTDGWVSGTTIEENVIYRCQGGGIVLKQTNDIINNVIVDMLDGPYYIAVKSGPNKGSKILRNILYDTGGNWVFPIAKSLIKDPNSRPRLQECEVDYNICFSAGEPTGGREYLDAHRDLQGSNSIYTDPLFNDLEDGDFRLRSDSPALKLGIKSLDVREMGITRDNRIPEEY